MASEIMAVPEEHLADVVKVIEAGLDAYAGTPQIHPDVAVQLRGWCDEEKDYLRRMAT